MTPDEFRKLALSQPEAVENEHMGHPDFRVGNKIFATMGYPGAGWAVLKLTLEQQDQLVQAHPKLFSAVPGGWGKRGNTRLLLEDATIAIVAPAVFTAWSNLAPASLKTPPTG